jgi:hypothetical protein
LAGDGTRRQGRRRRYDTGRQGKISKSEIRISKQIPKDGIWETAMMPRFRFSPFSIHSNLFRISSFGFRIYEAPLGIEPNKQKNAPPENSSDAF